MSTTEIITLIAMLIVAGGISSKLVQLLKRATWDSRVTWALSIILSGAVGLATAWLGGDVLGLIDSWGSLTAVQAIGFMAGVYATAEAFYALHFRPAAVRRDGV